MTEELLTQTLIDKSCDNNGEINCDDSSNTYTNCSFLITNEIEANNNVNCSSDKLDQNNLPKAALGCVRFKGVCDATTGRRSPDMLQISPEEKPVKFELGGSSATFQIGKLVMDFQEDINLARLQLQLESV